MGYVFNGYGIVMGESDMGYVFRTGMGRYTVMSKIGQWTIKMDESDTEQTPEQTPTLPLEETPQYPVKGEDFQIKDIHFTAPPPIPPPIPRQITYPCIVLAQNCQPCYTCGGPRGGTNIRYCRASGEAGTPACTECLREHYGLNVALQDGTPL